MSEPAQFLLWVAVLFVVFRAVKVLFSSDWLRRRRNTTASQTVTSVVGVAAPIVAPTPAAAQIKWKKRWEFISNNPTRWKLFLTFLAFCFLEIVLWTSVPWAAPMFTGGGLWHLAIYPAGMLILALASELPGSKFGFIFISSAKFCSSPPPDEIRCLSRSSVPPFE